MIEYFQHIRLKFIQKEDGASLMEFAVVTALMAVLAATAAPKFSDISENAKVRKSRTEIEKIAKQALNFYQDTAVKEGRGRFPGQTKYNQKVGGHLSESDLNDDLFGGSETATDENGNSVTLPTSATFTRFDGADGAHWVSIFGSEAIKSPTLSDISLNSNYPQVPSVWQTLFGDEILFSPFQDGHYVYQVLPGYGVGSQAEAPTLFIADLENPSQIHLVVKP